MTANHCMEGLARRIGEEQVMAKAIAEGMDPEAVIMGLQLGLIEIPAIDPMTLQISFIVRGEVVAYRESPTAQHVGRVMALNPSTDLALVQALNVPAHKVAKLAKVTPAVGEHVYTMGHPTGLYWTFMEGVVSAYHDHIAVVDKTGPFIQISMPVYHGNSGGGLFNEFGELVGIVSFMPPEAPNVGFCIHLESIRGFMAGQHLVKLDLTPRADSK